ncbi:MAG: putative S-layer protein [archaeon]|nr:putative S-layer protein [archaeon]MCR4324002.1 putative S-layer protein [Nanoarchaeota archaeon]
MINKKLLTFVGLFAFLVLSFGFASAITSSDFAIALISHPASVNEDAGVYNFSFNLTYNGTSEDMSISFVNSNTSIGTISIPTQTGMNGTANESRIINGIITNFAGKGGSTVNIVINATDTTGERDDSNIFSVAINDVPPTRFCPSVVGSLKIVDFQVTNFGSGSDEEWEALDRIETEVEVENTNSDDSVRSVIVEIKILDDNNNDVTNDFDIVDEKIDLGTIRHSDSKIATFEIKELPADLGEGTYKILIKSYSDGDEDLQCVDNSNDFSKGYYHEVDFVRAEDVAVIAKVDSSDKIVTSCGATEVPVNFPIYNIGTDKEKKVLVVVYNNELKIYETAIVNDLREGKRKDVDFSINIPNKISRAVNDLKITTYFDYDGDGDELSESSYDSNSVDDLDKDYRIKLEVVGCNNAVEPSVGAKLSSDAKVGQELVIEATILNNGDSENFVVSVSGFEGWAELVSVTPTTMNLDNGETGNVVIKLSPSKEGFQSFNLETTVGGESYSQPVSVNILAGESSNGFGDFFSNSKLVYYALAVLVLLIIVLIIIIVKVSRAPRAAQF